MCHNGSKPTSVVLEFNGSVTTISGCLTAKYRAVNQAVNGASE